MIYYQIFDFDYRKGIWAILNNIWNILRKNTEIKIVLKDTTKLLMNIKQHFFRILQTAKHSFIGGSIILREPFVCFSLHISLHNFVLFYLEESES